MPNWCYTSYNLVGHHKELTQLHSIIEGLISLKQPSVPNDFGSSWLGCLVVALGGDWKNTRCRGSITDVQFDGKVLSLSTETAWAPCTEVFELIRNKFPSINYYYFAEECGMEIYETNDSAGMFFEDRVIVEVYSKQTDWTTEYFTSKTEAYKWLETTFDCSVTNDQDVANLSEDLEAESEDYYVHLHLIQIV